MNVRRLALLVSVGAFAIAAAACGSDEAASNATDPSGTASVDTAPTDTEVGDTLPPVPGFAHPTGPDDVVIEYTELSGFTTPEYAFQQPPVVLISGDGNVYTTGPVVAIYPGPALPNIQVGTISEEAIQQLLTIAHDDGLFADIDYTEETMVADAPVATVTINVDGVSWVHSAYALGMDEPGAELSPERQTLREFTAQLTDLTATVGADQLGPVDVFEPTNYLIQPIVLDDPDSFGGGDIAPTVEEWPADSGVVLAEVGGCAVVPAEAVGDVFNDANQLTLFSQDGVTYQVIAVQQLPHRSCD